MSLFCRHNRFTADCPICSKGTVLDSGRATERRRPKAGGSKRSGNRAAAASGARQFSGPHVTAGPYARDEGDPYEVRLERVPGGVRLAQWSRYALEKRAPELPAADLTGLVGAAVEQELLDRGDLDALSDAVAVEADTVNGDAHGASPGRAGDMKEELRVERLPDTGTPSGAQGDDGRLRIGRWLFWPGRGWELQEAPPMLPVARYAQALREAARRGLLER